MVVWEAFTSDQFQDFLVCELLNLTFLPIQALGQDSLGASFGAQGWN